jgi:hypothetical protein
LHHDTANRGKAGQFDNERETYTRAPHYWGAEWFKKLDGDQVETISLIRDCWFQFPDRREAVLHYWTRDLPPAPKMPKVIAEIAASWGVY